MLSHAQLFVTPWTIHHQAPLSMGLSEQEHWSGLPVLLQGLLPTQGVKPRSSLSPIGRQIPYCSSTWEAETT